MSAESIYPKKYIVREESVTDVSAVTLPEVLLNIFSFLPAIDLINSCFVCKTWYAVSKERHLWKVLCKKELEGCFQIETESLVNNSCCWQKCYAIFSLLRSFKRAQLGEFSRTVRVNIEEFNSLKKSCYSQFITFEIEDNHSAGFCTFNAPVMEALRRNNFLCIREFNQVSIFNFSTNSFIRHDLKEIDGHGIHRIEHASCTSMLMSNNKLFVSALIKGVHYVSSDHPLRSHDEVPNTAHPVVSFDLTPQRSFFTSYSSYCGFLDDLIESTKTKAFMKLGDFLIVASSTDDGNISLEAQTHLHCRTYVSPIKNILNADCSINFKSCMNFIVQLEASFSEQQKLNQASSCLLF